MALLGKNLYAQRNLRSLPESSRNRWAIPFRGRVWCFSRSFFTAFALYRFRERETQKVQDGCFVLQEHHPRLRPGAAIWGWIGACVLQTTWYGPPARAQIRILKCWFRPRPVEGCGAFQKKPVSLTIRDTTALQEVSFLKIGRPSPPGSLRNEGKPCGVIRNR